MMQVMLDPSVLRVRVRVGYIRAWRVIEGWDVVFIASDVLGSLPLIFRMALYVPREAFGFHGGYIMPRSDVDLQSSQAGT
jgi:hypothetical protein